MQCQKYSIQLIWFSIFIFQHCGSLDSKVTGEELPKDVATKPHMQREERDGEKFLKRVPSESLTAAFGELGVAPLGVCPKDSVEVLGVSSHVLLSPLSDSRAVATMPIASQRMQAIVASCPSSPPEVHEPITRVQLGKDTKLSDLPWVKSLRTLEVAQEAVAAYLTRWHLESPAGRAAMWVQGEAILKRVETLRKAIKNSYRKQGLIFETQDIDPLVWNQVLQQQQVTKAKLKALRTLRARLLDTVQLNSQELAVVGLRTTPNTVTGEVELYSSDEETQQISDRSRRNHAAFVVGVVKVLQGRIKELLTLFDNNMGTAIAPYVTFLSSTPELPNLLADYTNNCLQNEADEEHNAELLGSLLTEAALQLLVLPKAKKTELNKIKHKLGQAAQRVVLHYTAQLKTTSQDE